MSSLLVTRIQRFSTQDGPGIRTTVFLQGCPLRCAWCHNPETQSVRPVLIWTPRDCAGCGGCVSACGSGARLVRDGALTYDRALCTSCGLCASVCPTGACELSAREMTVEEIVKEVLRDAAFFGTDGGVTLSGGEPLLQPDVIPLLRALKDAGLHVAVETSGYVSTSRVCVAAPCVDLWLYDLKDTDPDRHERMTGGDLEHVLSNLRLADGLGFGEIRLRCIMVKGVNMTPAHYAGIAAVYHDLLRCTGVDLLPYHAYAGSKAERIGMPDNGRREWIPSEDDMNEAKRRLSAAGVPLSGA